MRVPMLYICILFSFGLLVITASPACAEDLPWRQTQTEHGEKVEQFRHSTEGRGPETTETKSWFGRMWDRMRGNRSQTTEGKVHKEKNKGHRLFSETEKGTIKAFFLERSKLKSKKSTRKAGKGRGKSKEFPPGLARKESPPPGLAMQLERNGTLPPGLEKRNLPSDLDARLSDLPRGLARLIVGDDVLLTDEETGLILDIIQDVVTE